MDKNYCVYILANKRNGTLYIGISSDLIKRIWQHKEKVVGGFTKKYNVNRLVYFEQFTDPQNAIKREKRLKKYERQWKINLIEKDNPQWKDLYNTILWHLDTPDERLCHN
ncbi:MAG: GIY-YIG nuclease family protein [Deltaproteobacteria bacterium]|nr:GIY-YIG nuclease family protein [Deltaproteobacteria bacterium]